jgi:hypothetical protein
MKKYTENIESLQESAAYTQIDRMLKTDVNDLYKERVANPAFAPGGLKKGEPIAIEVLQAMERLLDKYTVRDSHNRLVLKSLSEIK